MASTNLSKHARDRLAEEIELLREQRRVAGDGLEDLDSAGDRMDNAEVLRRRDDIALLDARIAELTRMLAGGVPAPSGVPEDTGLQPGTRLTLRHEDGSAETLRAVAITEEIPPGEEDRMLTLDSPLGRALSGHSAGDTVVVDTPEGDRRVQLVDVEPPG